MPANKSRLSEALAESERAAHRADVNDDQVAALLAVAAAVRAVAHALQTEPLTVA